MCSQSHALSQVYYTYYYMCALHIVLHMHLLHTYYTYYYMCVLHIVLHMHLLHTYYT